ncbi:MAG: hypothetical protein OEU32_01695 [Acidimicrobiia bacterium]|nr:hypothetical protein [Acidimicrobiia bacterium]
MAREDEELLELLGRAIDGADPVPDQVVEAARAAFTWRTIDEELAELVFDSMTDELVGARSSGDAERQVTFRAPGVEIEVMVTSEHSRRLVGQLVPGQTAAIELRSDGGRQHGQADAVGRFVFGDISPGRVQLAITTNDNRVVTTEWLVL